MKQFYDFERAYPPPLKEHRLRAIAERRRLRHQLMLLVVAAVLLELCLLLFTLVLIVADSWLAILSAGYLIISLTGGSVLAIVCIQKRRELLENGNHSYRNCIRNI